MRAAGRFSVSLLAGFSAVAMLAAAPARAQTRPYNPLRAYSSAPREIEELIPAPGWQPAPIGRPTAGRAPARPTRPFSSTSRVRAWKSLAQGEPTPAPPESSPSDLPVPEVVPEGLGEPASELHLVPGTPAWEEQLGPPAATPYPGISPYPGPAAEVAEGGPYGPYGYAGPGGPPCDCAQCCPPGYGCAPSYMDVGGPGCGGCGPAPGSFWPLQLAAFAGVHGFEGPVDQGRNGNFGFHQGVNLGGVLAPGYGIGYQIGAAFYHSNLSGDEVVVPRTGDRSQVFLTSGLYRRPADGVGLQGGLVYDLLHDDYYVEMTLGQLRGELGWVGPHHNELGFWFTAGTRRDLELRDDLFDDDDDDGDGVREWWEPTDLFAFYYRRHFPNAGTARAWGGFTGRGDGLLGADLFAPITPSFGLLAGFNYLIPDESGTLRGAEEESWALGISLAWYPGHRADYTGLGRPLFRVADNAVFMVDRLER